MSRTRDPNTTPAGTTTCAAPGCDQRRAWNNQSQRYRSRYCRQHAKERRVAKQAAVATGRYTCAEVLATWDKTPLGAEFTYQGTRVYGLQPLGAAAYRAQLAGADVGVRIGAGETLQRLVKP